ncbi:MAG: TIGR03960 family B12-binding radical SAM protein [Dehalococcoidales bacterium]|nr:TIGR03960 family B12-binding radical SAM protein [Dehalococcoidales bacterium]
MIDLDKILHKVQKPARYTGGEWNSIAKDWGKTSIKIALSYPDVYEIGMSNMAIPILYDILNAQPDVLAERVFTPWVDMVKEMKDHSIPLFSLETGHPLKEFDVIGFSLGHEMTYTNVLEMLALSQIPVLAAERNESYPLVIAGGTCVLNPEPMADFIDFFVIGDGEEVVPELLKVFRSAKVQKMTRQQLLQQVATIKGIYVPSLYRVEYHPDGRLKSFTPTVPEASQIIQRRFIKQLPPPVTKPLVSYIEIVHDRGAVEIQRGCTRGCRFCQAGIIYRPVRERQQGEIEKAIEEIIDNCGYDEISLVSLSSGDYPHIDQLVTKLTSRFQNLALSLPSLHISSFSLELMEALSPRKKMGLTFAPEAGSDRMRQVINKHLSEEQILETFAEVFAKGWLSIKLYFMVGLPTETKEDIEAIVQLVDKIRNLAKKNTGRTPQIRVNASTFVPKAHTPFQWFAQNSEEELAVKHDTLISGLQRKGTRLSWGNPKVSLLEAALSRGDRRLGKVIHQAWQMGAVFDAWEEQFKYELWQKAFEEAGLDIKFYAQRERQQDELLPWAHIDVGATPEFLKAEYAKALKADVTPDCRDGACNQCGLERWENGCTK